MLKTRPSLKTAVAMVVAGALAFGASASAFAQEEHRDEHSSRAGRDQHELHGDRHFDGARHSVAIRERPAAYRYHPMERSRFFRGVRVFRPYGLPYGGFGFYYADDEAWRFLGLTAFSLAAYDALSEEQERAHEEAFIQATSAPIGEPIVWDQDGGSGSVTPVRDGRTADGRECREFQQEVNIGGKPQQAFGTACLQPDGSWQVVDQQ